VRLVEHEILAGHHPRRRVRTQGRGHLLTERKHAGLRVVGGGALGEVGEQRVVAVGVRVAVVERQVVAVYLCKNTHKSTK